MGTLTDIGEYPSTPDGAVYVPFSVIDKLSIVGSPPNTSSVPCNSFFPSKLTDPCITSPPLICWKCSVNYLEFAS